MSLKRKTPYTAIEPLSSMVSDPGSDDTQRHLNSRTRKRFRNDRPNDEVVYAEHQLTTPENTLRRLFTAQQDHTPPIPCHEDTMNHEPLPPPENVDPRQHTLLKFFKPARTSLIHPSSTIDAWKADDALVNDGSQHRALEAAGSSIGSGTNSPNPQRADTDGDLDTEMDSGSDGSEHGSRTLGGGLGWMG